MLEINRRRKWFMSYFRLLGFVVFVLLLCVPSSYWITKKQQQQFKMVVPKVLTGANWCGSTNKQQTKSKFEEKFIFKVELSAVWNCHILFLFYRFSTLKPNGISVARRTFYMFFNWLATSFCKRQMWANWYFDFWRIFSSGPSRQWWM